MGRCGASDRTDLVRLNRTPHVARTEEVRLRTDDDHETLERFARASRVHFGQHEVSHEPVRVGHCIDVRSSHPTEPATCSDDRARDAVEGDRAGQLGR